MGKLVLGKKTFFNEIVAKVERIEKHLFASIEVGEDLY
jgi:hypothetical protein